MKKEGPLKEKAKQILKKSKELHCSSATIVEIFSVLKAIDSNQLHQSSCKPPKPKLHVQPIFTRPVDCFQSLAADHSSANNSSRRNISDSITPTTIYEACNSLWKLSTLLKSMSLEDAIDIANALKDLALRSLIQPIDFAKLYYG
jgi:hypothetical protein